MMPACLRLTQLGLALTLALASAAVSADVLLAPTSSDQVPASLRAGVAPEGLDRQPVQMSWPLSADQAVQSQQPTYRAESKEFWQRISGTELARGVAIYLTAPGAVVRISPAGSRAQVLAPESVQISNARGAISGAMRSVLRPEDLAEGSAPFPEGSLAFRLDRAAGQGELMLQAANASGEYLLHVFDVGSSLSLSLAANRDSVLLGQSLTLESQLDGAQLNRIEGLITAPDGSTQAITFKPRGGVWRADVMPELPALGARQGLYEVHAWAVASDGKGQILRDAKTAFALAAPTARLTGEYALSASEAISLKVQVQVASASRYALDGTMLVSGAPVAQAQSAIWLDAGTHQIELRFEPASFERGLPKAYAIADLRLLDQGQLVTLERRALALKVNQDEASEPVSR